MMDNKLLEATYQVDETYLLHLQETDAGMEYQCFDKNGAEAGVGLIGWSDMLDSDIRSPLACARVLAIQDIGLDGEKVAAVSRDMLLQFPRGRKLLYQLDKAGTADDGRSIRFIDSHYNEKFRIPNGGVIQVTYPDREFSMKCSYIDDYHMQAGYSVYHICQFAEMLERGGATCQPEPVVLEEEAAWKVGGKGYVSVQTCDDGYDYTVYGEDYHEIDGGQIDAPERSMNEIRDEILADLGWDKRSMDRVDFDELQEITTETAMQDMDGKRTSLLEQLSGMQSISSGEAHAPKRKEPER